MPDALNGIRIIDFGTITAGANATQMLADLGADVIKIESASRPDTFRAWQSNAPTPEAAAEVDDPWNRAHTFNMVNRNKRGICLDLKQPRGRELVLQLARVSDGVAENYRHGVMDRLGAGYADLSAANPAIVMISIGSQGSTGPEADYGSYGSTLDALSGLMSMTGYADSPRPYWSSEEINYPDQVASIFSAGMLMAAIRFRNRTGRGSSVDLSQRELVTTLVGEQVLQYTSGHGQPGPMGNARPGLAPNDCYRCAGEDAWVAITCASDAEWQTLCTTIGRVDLAADPRFAAEPDRQANQAALRQELEGWTGQHTKHHAMDVLQQAGVRAGAVLTGADMLLDPHLRARGYFQEIEHTSAGRQTLRVAPYHLSETPPTMRTAAPKLGEHTQAVLREVLGTSDQEIQELSALHVTDNVPLRHQPI
ncbi:MAG: CoA transferase [Chloroflexi bacterium]|nr:CoA transferase [Chloroflexota bacterium]